MSEANNSLTMNEAVERNLLDRGRQGVIGKPLDRVYGPTKVTGRARYSYEEPVENVAYGNVLTAEIGRGRVAGIDAEAARAAPGVIAMIVDHPLLPADSAMQGALPRALCPRSRITASPSASSSRRISRRRDRRPAWCGSTMVPKRGAST
jgi:CO/xanthine dehydrogenase Mo-binding subunit